MRGWMCGLAVAVVAAGAPAQDAADPKAVIAKAIAAHGGADVLKKYPAGELDMKGRMAIRGADSDFTGKIVYLLPDKYTITLDLDMAGHKTALRQTVDGKTIKTLVNGKEQAMTEAQKGAAFQALALQEIVRLTPLLDGNKYTLKADKDADIDGGKASVVTVSAEGVKGVNLFFDQKTGRLVRTVHKALSPEEKEVTEESNLADFKAVDGVLLSMAAEVTHDGKKFMSLAVTSAKMLESVDPKRFAAEPEKK
jgi:hypothetical protein